MAIISSAKRYLGIAAQGSGQGTAATAPTVLLPIVKSSTTFRWDAKIQEEQAATGDWYIEVDGIPVQPEATGTIVVPFKPTTINALLAACGLGGGDLVPPTWLTVFVGHGDATPGNGGEWIYSDVYFTGGQMSVSQTAAAQWSMNFIGLKKPSGHDLRVPGQSGCPAFPAIERAYRLKDLHDSVLLLSDAAGQSASGVDRVDSLTLRVVSQVVTYHGTTASGDDTPSDIILEKLGAGFDITRAYRNSALKTAFLNSCGLPGNCEFIFSTTCGDTHSHGFYMGKALLASQDVTSPDNAPMSESLTFNALRNPSGSGAPLSTITL